ncbi:MAG: hypothetical protein Tsb007_15900 [Rhizobacter sp.]
MAGFDLQWHEGDTHTRVGGFDAGGQHERRQRLTRAAACLGEMRIQPLVELVVPRDHRAGGTGDEEKQRGAETEPAMKQYKGSAHARPHRR